jgi:AMMECR1 domain-containing protein
MIVLLIIEILLSAKGTADETDIDRWRVADAETERFALDLARRAFNAYAIRREVIEPPASLPPLFQQRIGVFVSAMRNKAPRCCMGTVYPTESNAARELIASAVAAAGRDRRFPAIKPSELKSLTLIVSFVSHPRPLPASQVHSLDPAHDGLMVKSGDHVGVVLSRETTQVERMILWGRIRAGVKPAAPVEFFRLSDVRFVEQTPEK